MGSHDRRRVSRRLVGVSAAILCLGVGTLFGAAGRADATTSGSGCFPKAPAAFSACSFVVSGSTVTYTFTITAPIQVSVASYVVPSTPSTFPQVLFDSATLYDASTGVFQPGTYSLSAQLPQNSCRGQVDLVEGPPLGPVIETGDAYQIFDANGTPIGSLVADAVLAGTQGCGLIEVTKQTDPSGSTQQFSFTGDLAGTIGDGGSIKLAEPAGTYTTTENVPGGWQLTSVTCASDGATGGGTSVSGTTTTYNLVEGELLSCTYLDTQVPTGTGAPLTIGYWKNWSSCTGASQAPVLDNTIQTAGGSILIGNLSVSTCSVAVSILNKSDISTGKKMASDPGFNLAAQLLAAKLNGVNNAVQCSAAAGAINSAQALLASVNFVGTGTTGLTSAQAAAANALASTLDTYNNGNLC